MDERIPQKSHEIKKRVNMMGELPDILSLPLPDEVRKAIEEILKEQGAKEELARIGVLKVLLEKGGEIRLVKMSEKNRATNQEIR